MVNPDHVIIDDGKNTAETMNTLLWNFIDLAAANPTVKPDPRVWPHLLVYAPSHIKQRVRAILAATGKKVEEPAPPAPSGYEVELKKLRDQLVEAFAKKHYETWADQEGYVPWQEGGNSDKQEEARKVARSVVDGLTPDNFYPVNSECSSMTVLPGAEVCMLTKIDYSPAMDDWLKLITKENSDVAPCDRDYFNMWTGQGSQDNAKLATEVGDALDVLKNAFKNDPYFAWTWHCAIWSGAHDEGLADDAANRAAARVMKMAFDIDTSENAQFNPEHRKAAKKIDEIIQSKNINHHQV